MFVGITLLAVVYKLGVVMNWWNPMHRPDKVSATARHVFLWESEAWLDCSIDYTLDVNPCKAWDGNGRLIAEGAFRLEGENRAANSSELHPSTTGPTGRDGLSRVIYLFGPNGRIEGKRLVFFCAYPETTVNNEKQ